VESRVIILPIVDKTLYVYLDPVIARVVMQTVIITGQMDVKQILHLIMTIAVVVVTPVDQTVYAQTLSVDVFLRI
jgi:hypothetical protein